MTVGGSSSLASDADDFRELSPGIWLSFRYSKQLWPAYETRKNKKLLLWPIQMLSSNLRDSIPITKSACSQTFPFRPAPRFMKSRMARLYTASWLTGEHRPGQGTGQLGYGLAILAAFTMWMDRIFIDASSPRVTADDASRRPTVRLGSYADTCGNALQA